MKQSKARYSLIRSAPEPMAAKPAANPTMTRHGEERGRHPVKSKVKSDAKFLEPHFLIEKLKGIAISRTVEVYEKHDPRKAGKTKSEESKLFGQFIFVDQSQKTKGPKQKRELRWMREEESDQGSLLNAPHLPKSPAA